MHAKVAFNVHERGLADGPVLLFAHGFGCDQNMWRFVAPRFEDRYRVVLFDYVGAGGLGRPYDPERYSTLAGVRRRRAADLPRARPHRRGVRRPLGLAMIGVLAEVAAPGAVRRAGDGRAVAAVHRRQRLRRRLHGADIDGLLDSLESNYLGWSSAMAPAIMGNPERPELGERAEPASAPSTG